MLDVQGLTKAFARRQGVLARLRSKLPPFMVLDDISFRAGEGERVALVGESGCGKSTLARALVRLLPLDKGRVMLDGVDLTALEGRALRSRRGAFQLMLQNPYSILNPALSVLGHLEESVRLHRPGEAGRARAVARDLLDQVGLAGYEGALPTELSGGQRRRVCLARMLATSPRLLIVDEPTTGLDALNQGRVMELLSHIAAKVGILMLISHDFGDIRSLATRVMVLHQGKMVEDMAVESFRLGVEHHPYTQRLLESERALARAERPPERGHGGLEEG